MEKAILGKKIGMTQIFDEEGKAIPVTVIESKPCVVVQKKNLETDGYNAIQVGFGDVKEKRVSKPIKGHFKKAQLKPMKYLREFRLDNIDNYKVGQEINVDTFKPGDRVDVTGISKGKGFAGGVKRWHFNRGPMGHGSMYHRRPGSLGATDPARVFKGRKLPGRMGGERVTVQNLEVIKVYPDRNLMLVKGAVPGTKNSLLLIKDTVKK
ncbi:50S ribosomal protein L3 [Koleobacter methoxysyntrophicus]|jgi:large subunit ribosomal protein L3|uniref:Large ribosomal subunit protein uL3 n=1 Tax=Koleobacter methoxysyntrophicus TaxID=2751313 RepID=A0A8A0RNE9_9FIRM|nr:50S ribosomal protein L3 [Koleobacter methoxysyntrophicus]QSQ08967.1 50S ribosomal protein L3 [Koleobacter methoxysyntrophicus]